jgi:hypothetical protein
MAHPSRQQYFQHLVDRLGDVPFSIDEGFGIWENCKRAWKLYDPTADYHVVIQDDAIICKDFYIRLEKFISRFNGKYAYQLYFGNRKRLYQRALSGKRDGYVKMGSLLWGVAICLPVKLIPEMVKYTDKLDHIKQDDTRIKSFLMYKKMKVVYPMPSLVDHRGEDSLVGDSVGRKAFYFIDNT